MKETQTRINFLKILAFYYSPQCTVGQHWSSSLGITVFISNSGQVCSGHFPVHFGWYLGQHPPSYSSHVSPVFMKKGIYCHIIA